MKLIEKHHILTSLALMPLIVPQGLYVKFRAAQMKEADGPRSGETGQGPLLRVLILGDSSAAGVGVAHQRQALSGQLVDALATECRVKWHLAAQTGATTASAIRMTQDLPPGPWDIVVTALGVNDVKNGVALTRYLSRTDELYRRLQDRFGARLIVCSGMPPIRDFPLLPAPLSWALQHRANIFDQAHRRLIDTHPACRYLQGPPHLAAEDMAPDGFHPGPNIYREWAHLAADVIRQNLPLSAAARPAKQRSQRSPHRVHFGSTTVPGDG